MLIPSGAYSPEQGNPISKPLGFAVSKPHHPRWGFLLPGGMMADTPSFLAELARQIKRHPHAYPAWLTILADDICETTDNLDRRDRLAPISGSSSEAEAARAFFVAD